MKSIAKIALATLALVSLALASCAKRPATVPTYAPANTGGGYIMPSK